MPIHRTHEDYVDKIHQTLIEHYGLHLNKRTIKATLNHWQKILLTHLKQAHQINLPYGNTITPVVPLNKSVAQHYYKIKVPISNKIKHLQGTVRKPFREGKYTDYQSLRHGDPNAKPWDFIKPLYILDNEEDKPLI